MSEADTDPDVGREHIEAALADPSLTSLRLSGAPTLVIASDPARVVFATGEARSLFGGDLSALTRRLLHGGEPGAQRLVALSKSLLPDAAPRLERLRFFFGPVAETVTILCRRAARPSGAPLFAVAVLGARAPVKPAPSSEKGIVSPFSRASVVADTTDVDTHDVAPATTIVPSAGYDAVQRPARFAWRTDSDHVFVSVSPALAAAVGQANAQLVGRSFVDVARELALDPHGRLAAALGARDTWSGLQLSWPVDDGAMHAPVTLGASPDFDADESFLGFRGFGLVHVDRIPSAAGAESVSANSAAQQSKPAASDETAMMGIEGLHDAAPTPEAFHETSEPAPIAVPPQLAVDEPAPHADTKEMARSSPVPQMDAQGSDRPDAPHSPANPAWSGESADQIISVTDGGAPVFADESRPADVEPAIAENMPDPLFVIDEPEIEDSADAPPPPRSNFNKVVPLRPQQSARPAAPGLTPGEKSAFDEIARALGVESRDPPGDGVRAAEANKRARDLIDLVARFGRSDEPLAGGGSPDGESGEAGSKQDATGVALERTAPEQTAPKLAIAAVDPPSPPRAPVDRDAGALLDRLPVGVVVSRFNVPIYANRTLLDLLDYADVDAFHAAGGLDRLFHGRAPDSGAAQIESRDGEIIPVDARVQAVEWDGQPATLVTLRRAQENADGARAKALELELRQRDADAREMHAILDTATDGVAVLDAEGRILSLNRSGEALFGYDQNEVAGEHVSILLAPESRDVLNAYFDGLKSGGVATVLNDGREIVGRARQGGGIPLFMTLGRLGSGANPKFCAVLRDLTAWKKAERELGDAKREAERASGLKSDFLAKISHEIRTPLNAILGFAEVIMDERFGPVGNDRYREYMRDIHKSGEHVLSLVNDLLDLSKIEAGKVDLTFTSVDANSVVGECVSIMQPQAARERVVMRLSLAPSLPNIVADERSLRQIVLNLLSNAVKYNEAGGQVIVSTALTDAGHAVVRIKDTGVGMSDSELETALEPFRQVATSRKIEGTGLGLPLTKALVEANRASFTIKSRKGEGTLVEVTFPPTRVLAE